jgi:hypothetical protein
MSTSDGVHTPSHPTLSMQQTDLEIYNIYSSLARKVSTIPPEPRVVGHGTCRHGCARAPRRGSLPVLNPYSVMPFSLNSCSVGKYTRSCARAPHSPARAPALCLSVSLSHTHTYIQSLSRALSLALSLPLSLTHSLTHSPSLSRLPLPLSVLLSPSYAGVYTRTFSHTRMHRITLTRPHTNPFMH